MSSLRLGLFSEKGQNVEPGFTFAGLHTCALKSDGLKEQAGLAVFVVLTKPDDTGNCLCAIVETTQNGPCCVLTMRGSRTYGRGEPIVPLESRAEQVAELRVRLGLT